MTKAVILKGPSKGVYDFCFNTFLYFVLFRADVPLRNYSLNPSSKRLISAIRPNSELWDYNCSEKQLYLFISDSISNETHSQVFEY